MATAYNNKGVCLYRLEKFDEAIDNYSKAIELNPYYLDAYINKGICSRDMGKLSEADKEFKKALELYPNNYLVYYHLGITFSRMDKKYWNKGMDYFELAIRYKPDYSETYFQKGILEMKMGLYGDAIQSFLKCKELRKKNDAECEKKIKECTMAVNNILNEQYNK